MTNVRVTVRAGSSLELGLRLGLRLRLRVEVRIRVRYPRLCLETGLSTGGVGGMGQGWG